MSSVTGPPSKRRAVPGPGPPDGAQERQPHSYCANFIIVTPCPAQNHNIFKKKYLQIISSEIKWCKTKNPTKEAWGDGQWSTTGRLRVRELYNVPGPLVYCRESTCRVMWRLLSSSASRWPETGNSTEIKSIPYSILFVLLEDIPLAAPLIAQVHPHWQ